MKRQIPYGRQTLGLAEAAAAFRAVLGEAITQGPYVEALEDKFCEVTNCKFAIAVSSGTAALNIATLAANVQSDTSTFVPALTFAASAASVVLAKGNPELVDISKETWNVDLALVDNEVESIVSVDFAGLPSGISERIDLTDVKIIQDCAHSLGGKTPSGPVGGSSLNLMSCFSLHPVKAVTAGEGGVVTTNDDETAEILRKLRSHGIDRSRGSNRWEYDIDSAGSNYRITDIQAAVALAQIDRLGGFISDRNEIADRYRTWLAHLPLTLPPAAPEGYLHAYHLFPILLRSPEERNFVYQFLNDRGIGVQVHYKPLHKLSAFERVRKHPSGLKNVDDVCGRILSLPIFPTLTSRSQKRVVRELSASLLAFEKK